MIWQKEISLPAFCRGYHLINSLIEKELGTLPQTGICHLFLKHSSAGLTINENADPSVRIDFESFINKLIPENDPVFTHTYEGSDDMPAHLKSSILGCELSIPISNKQLNLGTWQGIYLCEFRNYAGCRKLVITVYS